MTSSDAMVRRTVDNPVLSGSGHHERAGLSTLGADYVRVLDLLDRVIVQQAQRQGALEIRLPPMTPAAALRDIDYFSNFPQLGTAAVGMHADRVASDPGLVTDSVPTSLLHDAELMLPSSACYNLYFELAGVEIAEPIIRTVRAQCFRREHEYRGLQRLHGFTMREVVYVGTAGGARAHLEFWQPWITQLLDALGVAHVVSEASDPFYDSAERARPQDVQPAKHEFVAFGETAVASVNSHLAFFGQRCGITMNGVPVRTSCVGFGLDRWLWAIERKGSDLAEVAKELEHFADVGQHR